MFCLKLILSTIKLAGPASFLLVVTWDTDLHPFTLNFPVVLYLDVSSQEDIFGFKNMSFHNLLTIEWNPFKYFIEFYFVSYFYLSFFGT